MAKRKWNGRTHLSVGQRPNRFEVRPTPAGATPAKKSRLKIFFEQFGHTVNLVGVIVSTFLAFLAYYNTDQLRKLDSIIEESSQTSDSLITVVKELRQEHQRSDTMIAVLRQELVSSIATQNKTNELAALETGTNEMKLRAFAFSLVQHITVPSVYNKWDSAKQMAFFDVTLQLFAEVATNPYLLTHKGIYQAWYSLYADLGLFRGALKDHIYISSNAWNNNFPFDKIVRRVASFGMKIQKENFKYYHESKEYSQLTDFVFSEYIKIAANAYDDLSVQFKELTSDLRDSKEDWIDSSLSKEDYKLVAGLLNHLSDTLKTLRIDLASYINELENKKPANKPLDKKAIIKELKKILPTLEGFDINTLIKDRQNNSIESYPPEMQKAFKELSRKVKEFNVNLDIFCDALAEVIEIVMKQTRSAQGNIPPIYKNNL
jgi:hypothetical protein